MKLERKNFAYFVVCLFCNEGSCPHSDQFSPMIAMSANYNTPALSSQFIEKIIILYITVTPHTTHTQQSSSNHNEISVLDEHIYLFICCCCSLWYRKPAAEKMRKQQKSTIGIDHLGISGLCVSAYKRKGVKSTLENGVLEWYNKRVFWHIRNAKQKPISQKESKTHSMLFVVIIFGCVLFHNVNLLCYFAVA